MKKTFNTNTENKDEWLTPPHIIKSLGYFDLDPCSPTKDTRPWDTAAKHLSIDDNGLKQTWSGRVWCNPPYGTETFVWLRKLYEHGNGIALIFARTETIGFHEWIWDVADCVFFFKGRLKFYHVNGVEGGTSNAPSCLIAYGKNNVDAINNSGLNGKICIINDEAVK